MTVAPAAKRVQILTPEQEDTSNTANSPNPNAKRAKTFTGKVSAKKTEAQTEEMSNQFMKDLNYEDCHMLGIDSILQVNEVYENF